MKFSDITRYISESYQADIKRTVRDALAQLRIQGQTEVRTNQVLRDFTKRGLKISQTELISILEEDPLIQDVTPEKIVFKSDTPELAADIKPSPKDDQPTEVNQLAKRALNKRIKS